jgi:hypothetical protein
MKSDHEKNHKCLKRENRKKKAQPADFPNILRIKEISKA